ncbi:FBP domain-containing protein [Candidatus Saccharibacteria bacterium]|jgi:hypothetical protein|nr:FBP domain-containing protein [Candidatus Saccharibacteria bacterium]
MNIPTRDEFVDLVRNARISRRLQRDVRYVPEEIGHADARDFLAVMTKSRGEGVLLFEDHCLPFRLTMRSANARGRVEAVICDMCSTWQRGTNSAVITFKKDDKTTISHLVCADLDCSLHVRDLTDASKISRTQLREHITLPARIERLQAKLRQMIADL